MKRTTPNIIAVHFIILLSLHAFPSAARAVGLVYEVGMRSHHVWRGIALREFPIFTASATVRHHRGYTAQVWVGMDLSDENGREGEIQEVDLDFSRIWETERSAFTLGYVAFLFPGGIENTGELYAKWQAKVLLKPQLEVYYNPDLLRDAFALLRLSHCWQLNESWSSAATAALGYAGTAYAEFFGGSQAGLLHWSLHLDLDFNPRRYEIRFRLGYAESLNQAVLPDQPINLWAGLYLTVRHP